MTLMHKYKITIDGQSYTVSSDESEEVVLQSVEHLNNILKEIKKNQQPIERYQAALFAALQLANQVIRAEKNIAQINAICQSINEQLDTELLS